ncbi:unnamed protein product, partial [Ectocarpus fasciculatus]
RTAGECNTHYSGWKKDPAYLALNKKQKYGKVRCHICHHKGILGYDGACGEGEFHATCLNQNLVPAGSWICSGCAQGDHTAQDRRRASREDDRPPERVRRRCRHLSLCYGLFGGAH